MTPKAMLLAATAVALACAPMAAAGADLPCKPIRLKCSGFEPNWSFRLLANGTIRFSDPENPNWQTTPLVLPACAMRLAGQMISISAGAPLDLTATVTPQACTEPSGTTRPYSISISYKQGALGSNPMQVTGTGCCRK
jgi:uncharacterized membrane protein